MKLNDTLLSLCNGSPERFLALTPAEIIEWGRANPALLQHVALSQEHKIAEELKALKAHEKQAKKLQKEAEAAKKLAEKEKISKMSPEEAKAYRKAKKQAALMDKQGEPKLAL